MTLARLLEIRAAIQAARENRRTFRVLYKKERALETVATRAEYYIETYTYDELYALSNTVGDPTSAEWRANGVPEGGYKWVEGVGIKTKNPITNMDNMFKDNSTFNDADISGWDVSAVTSMSGMFEGATTFNQDIGSWDVSSDTDMSNMFKNASSFNQDLGNWNTVNATNMSGAFYGATSFNQDISEWNMTNVTDVSEMFREATAFNQDLSTWDTSNITNMDAMFQDATSFDADITDWDVQNITTAPTNFSSNVGLPAYYAPQWGTDGNVIVANPTTEIKIFFDSSGSMNTTLAPLVAAKDGAIKTALLPFFDNDEAAYNQNVTIVSDPSERVWNQMATPATNQNTTQLITLVFSDENSPYSAPGSWAATRTWTYNTDISALRAHLVAAPDGDYFRGVMFRVNTGPNSHADYRTFISAVMSGSGIYSGINGLSDKSEISAELDIDAGSTGQYYANKIVAAINALGYNLPSV